MRVHYPSAKTSNQAMLDLTYDYLMGGILLQWLLLYYIMQVQIVHMVGNLLVSHQEIVFAGYCGEKRDKKTCLWLTSAGHFTFTSLNVICDLKVLSSLIFSCLVLYHSDVFKSYVLDEICQVLDRSLSLPQQWKKMNIKRIVFESLNMVLPESMLLEVHKQYFYCFV